MIKQVFDVNGYWEVVVWYHLNHDLFYLVEDELLDANISKPMLKEIYHNMCYGKAKAVTYSNLHQHLSIVIFNPHYSKADFLNSVFHEVEHIKQAMLKAYYVEDKGEPPAYTVGYLISRMWEVIREFMCK